VSRRHPRYARRPRIPAIAQESGGRHASLKQVLLARNGRIMRLAEPAAIR
jgi:hypothetical protein